MVGHDYEIPEQITLTIEVAQAVGDDRGELA